MQVNRNIALELRTKKCPSSSRDAMMRAYAALYILKLTPTAKQLAGLIGYRDNPNRAHDVIRDLRDCGCDIRTDFVGHRLRGKSATRYVAVE
jgi:hypothetical protein